MMPAMWWKTAVVYQIYPRSFADSDGDGIGDLEGIVAAAGLPAALGVDVLWLSPVYPSPHDDNGYDISDYQDIDPGSARSPASTRCSPTLHERGMRLIMDLVVNHTSDEHPWFAESRSSKRHPKRDWYWWRAERTGRHVDTTGPPSSPVPPGSPTRPPASTTCTCSRASSRISTGRTPRSAQAIYSMMRWWLDRGVDGFRMDVINFISKDPGAARRLRVGAPAGWRTSPARASTSSCRRCTARSWPAATGC